MVYFTSTHNTSPYLLTGCYGRILLEKVPPQLVPSLLTHERELIMFQSPWCEPV